MIFEEYPFFGSSISVFEIIIVLMTAAFICHCLFSKARAKKISLFCGMFLLDFFFWWLLVSGLYFWMSVTGVISVTLVLIVKDFFDEEKTSPTDKYGRVCLKEKEMRQETEKKLKKIIKTSLK